MNTEPIQEYRMVPIERRIHLLEKWHVWLHRVWDAMREPLPATTTICKRVYPGDPLWDEAWAFDVRCYAWSAKTIEAASEENPLRKLI